MNLNPNYVPILHWKQGEQEALNELSKEVKDNILPLVEITPDFNVSNIKKTFEHWNNRYFYFDVLPECYEDNDNIYFDILEQLNPNYVIPVLVPNDALDMISYANSLSNIGIAIRITPHDIENINHTLITILNSLNPHNIDLIFDLGYVENYNLPDINNLLVSFFSLVPSINEFKKIIVSSSSFPDTLSSIKRNTLESIPRAEWILFRQYISNLSEKFNIEIIYSDYCISNPNFTDYKTYMKPSFNIRYTLAEDYVILKGKLWGNGGSDKTHISNLCNMLVSSDYFIGQDFSWGDNYIFKHSTNNEKGYGNLTTWRKVGVNHHITYIVNQLASLI